MSGGDQMLAIARPEPLTLDVPIQTGRGVMEGSGPELLNNKEVKAAYLGM
jgi:hypothetical protein